jgi:hypothetical protein
MIVTLALLASSAWAEDWQPVTGQSALEQVFTDTVMEGPLPGEQKAVAHYYADGTGKLEAWGDTFQRAWRVDGNEQACVQAEYSWVCYTLEQDADSPSSYRARKVDTGEFVLFELSLQDTVVAQSQGKDSGGATQPSAEEMAAKLANPTAPVMTIGNNIDFVDFQGDLPGASSQSSFRYVFQTVFPFKLSDGGSIFFRPAIPVMFNEPIPAGPNQWEEIGTDLADIGFDLSYGKTTESGLLWGAGVVGTIPTATDDRLGKDLWGLGPELLLGKMGKWGVVGGLISHQWDVAGSGDGDIDLTSVNYFYAFPLGGGWQVAAGPTATYDHTRPSGDRWTIPAGIGIAKTSIIAGRPWKFQLQYWNYVEAPDAFAVKHQIRLSINPVVSAPWNEGK